METLVFLVCSIPFVLLLIVIKLTIAVYIADLISGKCVIYSIYKNDTLKFSTSTKKEAESFYAFMIARYGKLAIRFETIKV